MIVHRSQRYLHSRQTDALAQQGWPTVGKMLAESPNFPSQPDRAQYRAPQLLQKHVREPSHSAQVLDQQLHERVQILRESQRLAKIQRRLGYPLLAVGQARSSH